MLNITFLSGLCNSTMSNHAKRHGYHVVTCFRQSCIVNVCTSPYKVIPLKISVFAHFTQ